VTEAFDQDLDEGAERRCIVTGERRPRAEMIRFAVAPDGTLAPDLAETLPGRGFWLSAGRDMVETAISKRLFARAARGTVVVSPDLADRIESLLIRRCVELLGLARRAGLVVAGFEKVRGALKAGEAMVYLVAARDGARDGRDKIAALAPRLPVVEALTAEELGGAMGRDTAVHLAVRPGKLATKVKAEMIRLARYRGMGPTPPVAEGQQVGKDGTEPNERQGRQ